MGPSGQAVFADDELSDHMFRTIRTANRGICRGGLAAANLGLMADSAQNLIVVVEGDLWCEGTLEMGVRRRRPN